MKKIIILLFLSFGTYFQVLAQSQIELKESELKSETSWETINENDYSIKHPSTWKADKSGQMAFLLLLSPVTDNEDKFKENVNLIIQDLTGYNLTLDKYVEISENQVKSMIIDSKFVLSERIKTDNTEHHKVIYTGKQGDYDLQFEQYYFIKNEKAYVLTLTCERKQFDAYKKVGEEILNSFILK